MSVIPFKKPSITPEKAAELKEHKKAKRLAEKSASPVPRERYRWRSGKKHEYLNSWMARMAYDDTLPASAYRAALLMFDWFNSDHGKCWKSVANLAKGDPIIGGMDERRLKEGRQILYMRGYLDREWGVPEEGKPATMIYYAAFPIPSADIPSS